MPNTRISALSPAVSVNATDVFPSVQTTGVGPVKTSAAQIKTYLFDGGTSLPVTSGGTGVTSLTAGYIPFGAGTSALASSANLSWDSVNNQLDIGAGTASLPALSTTSYNGTGLFFPAANTFGVSTAGAERLRVSSLGTVGIGGTPTAGITLDIARNITGAAGSVGIYHRGVVQSDATDVSSFYSRVGTAATSFTLNALRHYRAFQATFGAGSTVTDQFGFAVDTTVVGAANNYGFHSNIAVGTTRTISNVERTSNVATITTSAAHGYLVGQSVTVTATTNTTLNGTFVITAVPTTTTFSYAQTAADIPSGADTGSTVVVGRWNFYGAGTAPNAFVGLTRFGGTTAPVSTVDVTGSIAATTTIRSSGQTSGIGYATGAGGAVTQATNRTTGVTLNRVSGAITLVSAAGSATPATFTVTNSAVAATDVVIVSQKSGTDKYVVLVTAVGAGSFDITFYTTGGTTTEQPVFNFAVIKAVAA